MLPQSDARSRTSEQAALRADQRHPDIVAEALAQHRTQIADAVGDAERHRLAASPKLPGEQVIFWAGEARAAARFHQRDEILVNFALHGFEPFHVLRLLRQERVEHGLAFARGIEAPLDANLLQQTRETKRAADHAD